MIFSILRVQGFPDSVFTDATICLRLIIKSLKEGPKAGACLVRMSLF